MEPWVQQIAVPLAVASRGTVNVREKGTCL
jgi:hypothetical protein